MHLNNIFTKTERPHSVAVIINFATAILALPLTKYDRGITKLQSLRFIITLRLLNVAAKRTPAH